MKIIYALALGIVILIIIVGGAYVMWPLGAKVEDSFQKAVGITGPVKLEVETGSGDITVSRGNEGQLYISAKFQVRAASEEEARSAATWKLTLEAEILP